MITLDITTFIFLYALCSVIVILILWVIFGYKGVRRFSPKEIRYIWKCSLCSHIYVDSKHEEISVCPLCGSYNKKGVGE